MLSHILRLPEPAELDIPEKQLALRMTDGTIFRELLNEKRTLTECDGAAGRGDYVRISAATQRGGETQLQIELGGGAFPNYERALEGHRAGDSFTVAASGEETLINVESIKRTVDMPLTDGTIASLNLPGINTLADYRRDYIRAHGMELAGRVFAAIQSGLMGQLVSLTQANLDTGELERFHRRARVMIENISGGADARLMDAYRCATPEEADNKFFADNRKSFVTYLCGMEYARRDGRLPSAEERAQAIGYYGLIYDKSEEDIVRGGLEEEAMQSFYIQYAIGKVREYYFSQVRISADCVEGQSL